MRKAMYVKVVNKQIINECKMKKKRENSIMREPVH